MSALMTRKRRGRYARRICRTPCENPGCPRSASYRFGLCRACFDTIKPNEDIEPEYRTGLGLIPPKVKFPSRATSYPPGTIGKLEELIRRAEDGEPLWHPFDARPQLG